MITILRFLVASTDILLLTLCLTGLYFAFAHFEKNNKKYIVLSSGIILGIIGGFILFYLKLLYPKALNLKLIRINRYVIVSIAISLLLSFIVSIILTFKTNKDENYVSNTLNLFKSIFDSLTLCFLFVYSSSNIFRLTQEFVYFGESTVGTNTLFRVIGFTLGIILVSLVLISFYKIGIRLSFFKLNLLISITLFFSLIFYGSRAILALQRLKFLKPTKIVFKIMIFSDKYAIIFLYFILFIGASYGLYIYILSRNLKGTFKNSALMRKEKKRLLLNKRWAISIIIFTFLSFTTLTYIAKQENKEVELSPPKEYQQDETYIYIPLDTVDDGHLHRFSFVLEDKKDVRFIVVRKGKGSAYGVGLDACDICGEAGYYERKDEIICKKCDVVMNKATIGYKGGCNPVPFPYEIKDSKIIIDKKDLIKEGYRFKLKNQ